MYSIADVPWIKREYRCLADHLDRVVLPFWLERGPDREFGGFYTCFDGITHQLVARHKFLWAQGRVLWLLSELYRDATLRPVDAAAHPLQAPEGLMALAEEVARFVCRYGIADDARTRFVVTREGRPATLSSLDLGANDDPFASTYADCFVAMGLSAFARVSGRQEELRTAATVLASAIARFESGDFRGYPYPQPLGLTAHGVRMIPSMAAGEVVDACAVLGVGSESVMPERPPGGLPACNLSPERFIRRSLAELRARFWDDSLLFRELVRIEEGSTLTSLLLRYANPGHTLESCSLLWERRGIAYAAGWTEGDIARSSIRACTLGWDSVHRGLLAFILPGEAPEALGEYDHEHDPYREESLLHTVLRDWPNKLWWPHSEGMYTALAVGLGTRSTELLEQYETLRDYTFGTFPREDAQEWIHIRDRVGHPKQAVVALPLKDPYHIPRCFLKMLRTLERFGAGS